MFGLFFVTSIVLQHFKSYVHADEINQEHCLNLDTDIAKYYLHEKGSRKFVVNTTFALLRQQFEIIFSYVYMYQYVYVYVQQSPLIATSFLVDFRQ